MTFRKKTENISGKVENAGNFYSLSHILFVYICLRIGKYNMLFGKGITSYQMINC